VLVRVYPGTDIAVEMRLDAAQHLLRLLERYNWALADEARYADRWRKFWRGVSQIERTMVVMVVRANNGGRFSRHFPIGDMPEALEIERGNRRMVEPTDAVAREFCALAHTFYKVLIKPDEIKVMWLERMPHHPAVQLDALLRGLDRWLAGNGYDGGLLYELLRDEMKATGMEHDEAEQLAFRFDGDVLDCIRDKEEALYGTHVLAA
jgi:hypothetical protein